MSRGDLDRRPRGRLGDGVGDQLVQGLQQTVRVEIDGSVVDLFQADRRVLRRPLVTGVRHDLAERGEHRAHEVGLVTRGELKQPVGGLLQPPEFVDHNPGVAGGNHVIRGALENFRVPEGDGERGAHDVGSVPYKVARGLQQHHVVLVDPADLLPGRHGPPHEQHHGREHRRHQRDLSKLIGRLIAGYDVGAQADTRDDDDRGQRCGGGSHRPHPPPIQQSEADPNKVEWHGGPFPEYQDTGHIDQDENPPADLDAVSAPEGADPFSQGQLCSPRHGPWRSRPVPVSPAAAGRRRRPRSTPGRSCTPRPTTGGAPWKPCCPHAA